MKNDELFEEEPKLSYRQKYPPLNPVAMWGEAVIELLFPYEYNEHKKKARSREIQQMYEEAMGDKPSMPTRLRTAKPESPDYQLSIAPEIQRLPAKRARPEHPATNESLAKYESLAKARNFVEASSSSVAKATSFGLAFMPVLACMLFGALVVGAIRFLSPEAALVVEPTEMWQPIQFSAIGISDRLLSLIPVILAICFLMIGVASYALKKIKPRQVDWTDTNLLLEYTGSYSLAIKWASLIQVREDRAWDPLNGKQPIFILKNKQGLEFKIRLSDLVRQKDVRTFFSMIKANAPKAEIIVDKAFQSDNNYTELWLRYFSLPTSRANKGSMEPGMALDEGRYTIVDTLGGGGQGTAYRATYDPKRGQGVSENHILTPNFERLVEKPDVVLKEYVLPVHRGQLTAQKTAEKLKAEAEILSKIDHPQVVKVLDCFVEDFRGFLVLEYVQGETLLSIVNQQGPQADEQVIDWALQVCSVLSYLHHLEPPVVHRDITPDNLMLDQDGRIKLVDFNVAYQVDSSATATVVGKHAYIPAEQFRGKPVPASDIYALGGTLNFLLTGLDPEPITRSHPKFLQPRVSEALDEIVARATSTDLAKRYADVESLAADLSALLHRS